MSIREKPSAVTASHLPVVDGLEAGAVDLRHVASIVERHREDARGNGREHDAEIGQNVEEEIDLHQDGGGPDELDQEIDRPGDETDAGATQEEQRESDHHREHPGGDGDVNRDARCLDER